MNDTRILGVLDRPHRFGIGDVVRHVDAPDDERNDCVVWQLTLRIRELPAGVVTAYPTYVLIAVADGEVMNDILCTRDLVLVAKGEDA